MHNKHIFEKHNDPNLKSNPYAIFTLIPLIFKQTFRSEIKCFADIGENYLPKNESYQWINVCCYLGCNWNSRNKCR